MTCSGCYKEGVEGYCPACRKKMFDGARVSHILPYDAPKEANLPAYQEQTKRLSISGVQLKYSLKLQHKELVLTDTGGTYILKPVPPSALIMAADQAPANEHLTMQLASQVFKIHTAANALLYFRDGAPAYVTRRFDVRANGSKYMQEDMAQISGRTRQAHGENFKYEGTCAQVGELIKKYVAAAMPALEEFFKIILFNYIVSNGDAHLKNFSLIRTDFEDYTLAPAYDLMCTALHTPHETDVALELYEGDLSSDFYRAYGFYGRPNFEELARRLELVPERAVRIIGGMTRNPEKVQRFVKNSFLSNEAKERFLEAYTDKSKRFEL